MATIPHTTVPHRTGAPEARLIAGRKYVWELPVRLSHWVNAIAIAVLFLTGLFIAAPVLQPSGEAANHFVMGKVRMLHFAFAYALMLGVLIRVYWFFVGNNYARSGFPFFWRPSWYRAVFQQVLDYMHLDRGHIHIGHNSLAGASYAAFFAMCGFEGITGFALYGESNPGGLWDTLAGWSVPLLGGSFRVHMWHHLVAWFILVFVVFHLYIALYDSQLYKNGLVDSIIAGPKFYEPGDHDADKWIS
jgi:Ni/Fe-hydrogenase 1 B-type cytochrome subunit